MRKHRFYLAVLVTALSVSFILAQSFPPPKPITDEEQIRSILIDLEQGIKSQNLLRLMGGFADSLHHGEGTVSKGSLEGRFRSMFARSSDRWEDSLFRALTPVEANLTGTWDFELEIDTLRFLNDHTVQVNATVYFGGSEPDTTSEWEFGRKHQEIILFKRGDGQWQVSKVQKLFRILDQYGNL